MRTRLLFVESETGWTAIDIDHGFTSQGRSFQSAWRNFKLAITDTIVFYQERGLNWLDHTKPASEYAQKCWDEADSDTTPAELISKEMLDGIETEFEWKITEKELCPA